MGPRYSLNFLLTKEKEGWCARCLEYDFVTQADTLDELYREIERTVVGHFVIGQESGLAPFHGLKRAAKKYWDQFANAHTRVSPVSGYGPRLDAIELHELRFAEVT